MIHANICCWSHRLNTWSVYFRFQCVHIGSSPGQKILAAQDILVLERNVQVRKTDMVLKGKRFMTRRDVTRLERVEAKKCDSSITVLYSVPQKSIGSRNPAVIRSADTREP